MTTDAEIPDDVQALLRDHIESHEELEVLLLLYRSREQWLDLESIQAQSRLPGVSADTTDALVQHGLLAVRDAATKPVYTYCATDPSLQTLVTRLAQAYAATPLAVMKLMTTNAMNRLRASALQTFADAFVLRGKRKRDV